MTEQWITMRDPADSSVTRIITATNPAGTIARVYTPWDAAKIAASPDLLEVVQLAVRAHELNGAARAAMSDKLYGPQGLAHAALAKALPNSGQSGAGKGGE